MYSLISISSRCTTILLSDKHINVAITTVALALIKLMLACDFGHVQRKMRTSKQTLDLPQLLLSLHSDMYSEQQASSANSDCYLSEVNNKTIGPCILLTN